jgi:hypothetical protein
MGDPVTGFDVPGTASQPEQPQMVPPQPLPTLTTIGHARAADGSILVVLQMSTPQGMSVFFLDQRAARKIGVDLQEAGSKGGGLVIASADAIPTPVRQ